MISENTLLCVGECMVEMSPTGGDCYRMGFAGDTFNMAWYARRLLGPRWDVSYTSCVGTDATSDRILDFMRDAGIGTNTVRRLDHRTVGSTIAPSGCT